MAQVVNTISSWFSTIVSAVDSLTKDCFNPCRNKNTTTSITHNPWGKSNCLTPFRNTPNVSLGQYSSSYPTFTDFYGSLFAPRKAWTDPILCHSRSFPTSVCLMLQPIRPYCDVFSLEDFSKSSSEIIRLHQTAVLALIYLVLMNQTNQSFLMILYKTGAKFCASKMELLNLSMDFSLCSRRGACIRIKSQRDA